MSSPFASFRKNQKMMMAILGVMVMVAFLILPPLLDYAQQQPGAADVDVVSTRYGVLKASDIERLARRRLLVTQYINNARSSVNLGPIQGNLFGDTQPESLVQTMLLARKAEEVGLYVPDDRVVALLDMATDKKVDGAGFARVASQLHVQESEVMAALRYEMMAQQYLELQFTGTQIPTPASRWNMFESLNREVALEVIPLPVDNFLLKVKKPEEAELRDFFEQHKFTTTTVKTGVVGFKQPPKAAFEYFQLKLDDFTSQVAVTDEEIAAAYERDKELYRYEPQGAVQNNPFATPSVPPMDSGIPTDDEAPAEGPVTPVTGDDTPASETTPVTPPTTEDAAPADSTTPATEPATETTPPASETPAEKPQSSTRRSPFTLASYRQNEAPATGTETAPPTETATPTETPAPPVTPEATAAETTPPAVEPPTESAPPVVDEPFVPANMLVPISIQEGPQPKYKPVWDVREEIRKGIAQEKARGVMARVVQELNREMSRYESQYRGWVNTRAAKPDQPAPTPPNFADLAKKYGIVTKKTPLLARDAFYFSEEFPLSKSYIGDAFIEQNAVFNVGYADLQPYQARQSNGAQGDEFLFWKTDSKDTFVPEFDAVRGEVEEAWKLEQARKLALEEAKKLAEQATKAGKSLREAFADRPDLPVISPRPFTWRFGGFMFGQQEIPIRISTVEGLPDVGNDFMQAAYRLAVGESGVATDDPKSTVYLMQLQSTTPETSQLQNMFLSAQFGNYARAGMDEAQMRQARWRQELNAQADVVWLQAPQDLN